jgi:hypothetical protein
MYPPRVTVQLVGRPKLETSARKSDAVQLRLSAEEREQFDRLVEARSEELRPEGVTVTAAGVLRWLVLRELAARGFGRPLEQRAPEPRRPKAAGGRR